MRWSSFLTTLALLKFVSSYSPSPTSNKKCSDPNAESVECAPAQQCRSTCADPNPGPCIQICVLNDCVCKKGFVLSGKGGKCVKVDQCPKNSPCNGDYNAVIKANPIPCPSTCASPNASPYCKKYAPPVGCECKPGYLKVSDDRNGKCIKPDECKGGNPCGVNENFVSCNVGCPTNYCPVSDNRAVVACDTPFPCPSGCACKSNYRRKSYDDNKCVLALDCPPMNCTRQNEIWSPCPSSCLRDNCSDLGGDPLSWLFKMNACNTLLFNCQPQCICKTFHFRNDKGICVPAKQCPINKQCKDPNTVRVLCAPAPECRPTCAAPNTEPCILTCTFKECLCKKGFILSEKGGKCIPVDQCPSTDDSSCNGDPNAVIKASPLPCPSTCDAPNASPNCKNYPPSIRCECKPGYLKLNDLFIKKCIKPDECKGGNPCGVNGTFVACNAGCPSNYCPVNDDRGIIACDPPFPCPSGCACKLNYRKKSYQDNKCILASDCPPVKCTRQNEIWSPCPSACLAENCADVNNQPSACNTLVLNCQPQCICKKGYFRDGNGICVPARQCNPKPIKCLKNEKFSPCRIICPPQTCASIYTLYSCQLDIKCEPGCDCISGYLRNGTVNDLCIPSSQCSGLPPNQCGLNQVYKECGSACERSCADLDKPNQICTAQCVAGCFCRDGYIKDDKGNCIPRNECPLPVCNKPNEVGTDCGSGCNIRNCEDYNRTDIVCPAVCIRGCFCIKDYVRDANGVCISRDKCPLPVCNKPNEEAACRTGCNARTCENYNTEISCIPECTNGCFCIKGYVRNANGACILPKQCPPKGPQNKCGPLQEYKECGTACQVSCADLDKPNQICKEQCVTGCFCKEGYLKDDKGNCIERNKCPLAVCNKPNEEAACRTGCNARTCENYNDEIFCIPECTNGCFCIKGYVRNANGACVLPNQCPPKGPHNRCGPLQEYKECGTACEPSCDNPNPICTKQCVAGCFCKEGYIKDDKGNCIPRSECPLPVCNKPNEEGRDCGSGCDNRTCEDYKRTDIGCAAVCVRGCFCIKGYVREANGVCISTDKCPPPSCKENERYTSCGTACPTTCLSRGQNCTSCTQQCVEGCFCSKGFIRVDGGPCVKPENCPKPKCNDPNEVFVQCPPSCPPGDDCSNIWTDYDCSKFENCCKPQCQCKAGYYRNNGKCITTQQCIHGGNTKD